LVLRVFALFQKRAQKLYWFYVFLLFFKKEPKNFIGFMCFCSFSKKSPKTLLVLRVFWFSLFSLLCGRLKREEKTEQRPNGRSRSQRDSIVFIPSE
jgi:hypothetical protein